MAPEISRSTSAIPAHEAIRGLDEVTWHGSIEGPRALCPPRGADFQNILGFAKTRDPHLRASAAYDLAYLISRTDLSSEDQMTAINALLELTHDTTPLVAQVAQELVGELENQGLLGERPLSL